MRTRHSYQEYNRGTSIHANRSSSGRISRKPFIRVLSRQGTKAISYSTLSSLTNKLTEHGLLKSFLKSVPCICMFNVYLQAQYPNPFSGFWQRVVYYHGPYIFLFKRIDRHLFTLGRILPCFLDYYMFVPLVSVFWIKS